MDLPRYVVKLLITKEMLDVPSLLYCCSLMLEKSAWHVIIMQVRQFHKSTSNARFCQVGVR